MSRWRSCTVVGVTLVTAVVAIACAEESAPPPELPGRQAEIDSSWSVGMLDDDALGTGWTSRDLPDPPAGVLDGLCGIPEVLEHFPPREVVRYERDAVVTHAVVETDDAPGLAALLVTEVQLCEQEDARVSDADRVQLDVDAPPTDAFRLQAVVESLDVRTDAVWAITAVDATHVSVVGASVTELFEDPADPLRLVTTSVEHVYRHEG